MRGEKWHCPKCGEELGHCRIHGCERSGTTAIEMLLRECFPQLMVSRSEKHRDIASGTAAVIIPSKHPLAWALSVFNYKGNTNWTWLHDTKSTLEFERWVQINRPVRHWVAQHRRWLDAIERRGLRSLIVPHAELVADPSAVIDKLSDFVYMTATYDRVPLPSYRIGFPAQDFDRTYYAQNRWLDEHTDATIEMCLEDADEDLVAMLGHGELVPDRKGPVEKGEKVREAVRGAFGEDNVVTLGEKKPRKKKAAKKTDKEESEDDGV
jgi:hypothetical protein